MTPAERVDAVMAAHVADRSAVLPTLAGIAQARAEDGDDRLLRDLEVAASRAGGRTTHEPRCHTAAVHMKRPRPVLEHQTEA